MDNCDLTEQFKMRVSLTLVEFKSISSVLEIQSRELKKLDAAPCKYSLTLTQSGWFVLLDKRVNPVVFLIWHKSLKAHQGLFKTLNKLRNCCDQAKAQLGSTSLFCECVADD